MVLEARTAPPRFRQPLIGLVLYMFIIGMEFNHRLILGRVRHASLVSGAGIAVPLALGAAAALALRGDADRSCPT